MKRDKKRESFINKILKNGKEKIGKENEHVAFQHLQGKPMLCSVEFDSVTLWPVAHRLLCSKDFPGKNIGECCRAILQGASWPRGWTRISCTGGQTVYYYATTATLSRCKPFHQRAVWQISQLLYLSYVLFLWLALPLGKK